MPIIALTKRYQDHFRQAAEGGGTKLQLYAVRRISAVRGRAKKARRALQHRYLSRNLASAFSVRANSFRKLGRHLSGHGACGQAALFTTRVSRNLIKRLPQRRLLPAYSRTPSLEEISSWTSRSHDYHHHRDIPFASSESFLSSLTPAHPRSQGDAQSGTPPLRSSTENPPPDRVIR